MYKVISYTTSDGKDFVFEFLASLPENVRIKVLGHIKYLEQMGPLAKRPYAALLRDKIYELRITFGHLEPRILYFFDRKFIVLTHGFLKKTAAVPSDEIEKALRIMSNYTLSNKRS